MPSKKTLCQFVHPDDLQEVVTFVLAGGKGQRLFPLTQDRSKPAVPFGGTFRIVDFVLSNCINSGLRRIFLLTQFNAMSLLRHINLGWNILSPELGEFIYPIAPQLRGKDQWFRSPVDAVYQNLQVIEREGPSHVLILSGDHIYRMDYRKMLADHLAVQADLTLGITIVSPFEAHRFGVVEVDGDNRVCSYREKPEQNIATTEEGVLANMGIFLFRTEVLREILDADARNDNSQHDFGFDLIPDLLSKDARVFAHRFEAAGDKPGSYWRDIGTRDAYYEANMDLVSISPSFSLYDQQWPIRSSPIQAPPAKFVFAGNDQNRVGQAMDSLVSPGVIVSGGQVFRSIVGPNCRINSWARVEDSILMDSVNVGRHAIVRRAIVDRGVQIPSGVCIGTNLDEDRKHFPVTEKGVVLVPSDTLISSTHGRDPA